ncbi:MAG: L,D-transpeptidase [Bacteriovorax sp.]|nr:L,D-transpeptidase [Bacteriovorax sp.]
MKIFASLMLLTLMGLLPLKNVSAQYDDKSFVFETYNKEFFVSTNGLRVRSTPDDVGKVMGLLNLNDKVLVVGHDLENNKFVEVKIVKSATTFLPAEKYYVVLEFLSLTLQDYKDFKGKYFVVVNVATETLRLYERQCMDNSCPHKLVMETEVVVGEDKDHPISEPGKGRSIVGSYRVVGWTKFYEDSEGHYPSWYKTSYPMPPEIGNNNWRDWFSKKVMPNGLDGEKEGKMRGAFGWYTAFVSPNPYGQWTHGTVGWGENKDEYIKKTKKFMINVVSNPRSSGCTRNNNEAIAFLRQIVETGAPIVKIYAKEALLDPSLSQYPQTTRQWKYIMTKNAGQRADRAEVLKALGLTGEDVDAYWNAFRAGGAGVIDPASKLNQILEVGTYDLDTQPTAIPFTTRKHILGKWRATGRNGNVYGLKDNEMSSGVYYVDAGLLSGYHHPSKVVEVSGFMDEETPPWMNKFLMN